MIDGLRMDGEDLECWETDAVQAWCGYEELQAEGQNRKLSIYLLIPKQYYGLDNGISVRLKRHTYDRTPLQSGHVFAYDP